MEAEKTREKLRAIIVSPKWLKGIASLFRALECNVVSRIHRGSWTSKRNETRGVKSGASALAITRTTRAQLFLIRSYVVVFPAERNYRRNGWQADSNYKFLRCFRAFSVNVAECMIFAVKPFRFLFLRLFLFFDENRVESTRCYVIRITLG